MCLEVNKYGLYCREKGLYICVEVNKEEMRHLFSHLVQDNPRLNVQDIPRCAGSMLALTIDAISSRALEGQNLPQSFGSPHALVLLKTIKTNVIGMLNSLGLAKDLEQGLNHFLSVLCFWYCRSLPHHVCI
ncbi:hypothetical protein AABB24_029967 [Solanum stoloniferum]|uniref:Uncharacterized protein n=1 Tax=Solanum stoloniferum TaxID=62892 RepID=A0ABD2S0Z1_9SOLN